jgi:predicted esterase
MSNPSSIDELQSRLQQLYAEADYTSALELATAGVTRFPEHSLLLLYWQITMSARLENTDQAIRLLRQVLSTGQWYGEVLLRYSPSLKTLQGNEEFESLVLLNRELQELDQEKIFPLLTLRSEDKCRSGGSPCPLMIALHANVSTAQASIPFWRPAASVGWLVAVPQSSQPIWKDAYVWDDREYAMAEIARHFSALQKKYTIDPQRIILAGHSMGGEMAIWLALKAAVPVCGFIALGPEGAFIDELENWQPLLQARRSTNLRGYLVVGQEDRTIPLKNVRKLAAQLNKAGIACQLEVIPDVGHDFSVEYEASLLRGLDYILSS